jgi:hypothetical protein
LMAKSFIGFYIIFLSRYRDAAKIKYVKYILMFLIYNNPDGP